MNLVDKQEDADASASEAEADKRRDEALKRMLNTPPKPRTGAEAKERRLLDRNAAND